MIITAILKADVKELSDDLLKRLQKLDQATASMLELTLTQSGAIRHTDIRVVDLLVDGEPILAKD
jgi:hypothetical protein